MAIPGYARMGSMLGWAGRRARTSKPCGPLGSTPQNLDEQRRICTELQLQLWQDVPYIPMGEYWQATA